MKLKVSLADVITALGKHTGAKTFLVATPRNTKDGAVTDHEVEFEADDLGKVLKLLRKGDV